MKVTDSRKKTKLTSLTANQLHSRLVKRKLGDARINELKQWVLDKKVVLRRVNTRHAIVKRMWGELVSDISEEIKREKAVLIYHNSINNEAHIELHQVYLEVLCKARETIRSCKKVNVSMRVEGAKTPMQMYPDRKTWVDWIPEKVRRGLIEHYNSLEHNYHARNRRELFKVKDKQDASR